MKVGIHLSQNYLLKRLFLHHCLGICLKNELTIRISFCTLNSSLLICTLHQKYKSWLSSLVVSWEVWVPRLYSFSRLFWLFLVPCISIRILGSVCQFLHIHTKAGIFIETSLKLCINLGVWNENDTVFEYMNKGLLYFPLI